MRIQANADLVLHQLVPNIHHPRHHGHRQQDPTTHTVNKIEQVFFPPFEESSSSSSSSAAEEGSGPQIHEHLDDHPRTQENKKQKGGKADETEEGWARLLAIPSGSEVEFGYEVEVDPATTRRSG